MKQNIILITSDQQHYRSMGCTGSPDAVTPNLDRLAGKSVVFDKHFVTNPVCSPSRGSFMTGLYPCESGLWMNGCALPQDKPTLATTLKGAGYQTAHFGKLHLVPILDRVDPHPHYGFDVCRVGEGDQMYPSDDHMIDMRRSDPLGYVEYMNELYKHGHYQGYGSKLPEELHHTSWVTENSANWLQKDRKNDQPFFLNVGYFDPHHAFNPLQVFWDMFAEKEVEEPHYDPESMASRPKTYKYNFNTAQKTFEKPGVRENIIRAFHAMMHHLDTSLGRLFGVIEAQGLLDNTVIIYSSDHGEFMGHHGMLHKGPFMLDDLMHVPMIVRTPGGQAGRVNELTSMIDLMKTFTTIAGVESPSPHGKALIDNAGKVLPEGGHDAVFGQWENATQEANRSLRMIRTQTHKLIAYADPDVGELYDLTTDPNEFRNLFGRPEVADVQKQLHTALEPQLSQHRPNTPKVTEW